MTHPGVNHSDGAQAGVIANLPIDSAVARDAAQSVKQLLALKRAWPGRRCAGGAVAVGLAVVRDGAKEMTVAYVSQKGEHPSPPLVDRVGRLSDRSVLLGADRMAGAVRQCVAHRRPCLRPEVPPSAAA